jgi:catechol 2,3-dioxygenase
VADLERATAFYRDLLGFTVVGELPDMCFLAAGDYHHHIALNARHSTGGAPAGGGAGLHHFAILLPSRDALADTVGRILAARYPVDAAEDHGATVAVYLRDPDGNGIELSYDRPREHWLDRDGNPVLKAEPFDPLELLVGWSVPVRFERKAAA